MTHDVFISYASEDKSAAEAARAALEAQGVSCWIAPRDVLPGEDETESILAAIDTSNVVVVCLSPAANASKLVIQQAARAFNKNIPVIALRIKDVEPSNALKLFFGTQEGVDAYTPPLDANLQRLVEIIAVLLKRPQKKQGAVSDVVGATVADRELEWSEPWVTTKGGTLQKTASPDFEEHRPARDKDQSVKKRSLVPMLLVAAVLVIFIVIAAALASNVLPPELTTLFRQTNQPPEQINTPSLTPTSTASLTVLYFHRPDCPACTALENTTSFKNLENTVTVTPIVSTTSALTGQYSVTDVPTLILLNNGKEVGRWVGPGDASAIKTKIDSLSAAG